MKKLFLTALMLATTAHAEVYKCGASYSSTPCGNDAVKIETPAANTPPQQTAGANIIKVLTGKVVKVADGDTITLDSGEKIRFAQIDTPEISHFGKPSQPFGKEAGAALRQMVKDKNVRVEVEAVDQYGRNVGTVYVDNLNVNRELVKNGFAWVYRQYAHDPELIELEKAARAKRTGLWMLDNPIYPPDFRKSNK
jgi:endonuclease YncB( thermonuclease family)